MIVHLVDLFCGCGGFSTGAAENPNVRVALAVDHWQKALDVHRDNHPGALHWNLDVATVEPEEMASRILQALPSDAEAVHVHASPPCQLLSVANRRTNNPQEGMHLVFWALDTLLAIQNLARQRVVSWTLEQVDAKAVRDLLSERRLPYRRVQASRYGVPQNRKRIIAYHRIDFDRLDAAHLLPAGRFVSMAEALGLPDDTDLVQMGSNHDCTRSAADNVAYTITSVPFYIKFPSEDRWHMLDIAEVARLQTFPASFSWAACKAKTHRQRMIGNAVPPLIARLLLAFLQMP